MIQMQSLLEVADNSGAKQVKCLKVLGGSRRRYAVIGDIISVAVQETLPKTKVKAGDVVRAVIVRTVHDTRRRDGSTIRFDNNSVVLVSAQGEPVGTRVSGPVARELRGRRFAKIISLAPEVL